MSNSPLICYTKLSPNYTVGRKHVIDRITPHYMAGNLSIETCGEVFAPYERRASSNYGIGSDGRIGLYVEEKNRPWTSGSSYNDNRAVTIECANLGDGSLTNACWVSLVNLCADICRRNNIPSLNFTNDDSGNLTMHKWYQNTDCPGPWLSEKFANLAHEVNELLFSHEPIVVEPKNNTQGGKLDVDGHGGYNTVLDLQHALGTYEDGIISGQWYENKMYHWGFNAVEYGAEGSQVVRELQTRIGAIKDGFWGKETSLKAQQYLTDKGFTCFIDGFFGSDSVAALQRYLNDGGSFNEIH